MYGIKWNIIGSIRLLFRFQSQAHALSKIEKFLLLMLACKADFIKALN